MRHARVGRARSDVEVPEGTSAAAGGLADSVTPHNRLQGRGRRSRQKRPGVRRSIMMLLVGLAFLLVPSGSAWADPTDEGGSGSIPACPGEPAPYPESAGSGSDGLLVPPQAESSAAQSPDGLPPDASIYGQYGTAGQQWHVIREDCLDKLGSAPVATMANVTWDLSKTINQSTITVYQAATTDSLLNGFNDMISRVVAELRDGFWQPLLPTMFILGAVALAWYGLIRKRVTLTFESAIWMVLAVVAGMLIIGAPSQVMASATRLVNAGGELVNTALNRVSVEEVANTCPATAPNIEQADWESSSEFAVRKNSQQMWSGLICRPWLSGQFGTLESSANAEVEYGMNLLESQGISRVEQQAIDSGEVSASELVSEKQSQYEEIATGVSDNYPELYPVFDGSQSGERLSIATLALFAAVFGGGLILVASLALIVLKIGFILLLLLAPIFFLIGIHPGLGRSVLLRWFELMLGILLKQIFMVILIGILVMCYSIVMASPLSWGLKVILLAMFTVAVFVYRKPFAHLFASVNANTFTSRIVNDALQSRVMERTAGVLPPVSYMRTQRWGLRNAAPLAGAAGAVGAGAAAGAADGQGSPAGPGADQADSDGGNVRTEGRRLRGTAGYGHARGKSAPPPLNLGNARADSGAPQAAPPPASGAARSSSEAPGLYGLAASGGIPNGRQDKAASSIPPRPAGGYRGTGDTGWASVFGTGSSPRGGAGEARQAPPERGPAPSSGTGIFSGRQAERPLAGGNERSRWGGARPRRDRQAPPPPRPAAAPSDRGERGNWFSGSGRRDPDRPISPFWTGTNQQRRADRDVPFWLRNDD